MSTTHFTSLINLKEEFIERYIILHKHTFPGVLERIALSNIKNYSIFLEGNRLFSHFEYNGESYSKDTELIGNEVTREWWKLTDPMQEPLKSRKENEWWASTEIVFCFETTISSSSEANRFAYKCIVSSSVEKLKSILKHSINEDLLTTEKVKSLIISHKDNELYIYLEQFNEGNKKSDNIADSLSTVLSVNEGAKINLIPMKEVFYTNQEKPTARKKVFVTGCFDMLHSGHVAFLEEAATYGDLHVSIGSDENVYFLKGRYPINSQDERIYMISALKFVKSCTVNSGFGLMDFIAEIEQFKPDIFVVNEDGNSPSKAEFCSKMGIEYKVLKRIPHQDLPRRSTTDLRKECVIPFRIDLAGGWLDQPYVSKYFPGPVLTISIEPTIEFNERSGMASSTRRKAIELWKTDIPQGNREHLAKVLFSFENPPGTQSISGSQDSLGIVLPGLNKLNYENNYWPSSIETISDEETLKWIEDSLYLITLGPRRSSYSVLDNTKISEIGAKALSDAAEGCWNAIKNKDIDEFGKHFRKSFEAQIAMFPNMVDDEIMKVISTYNERAKGWKLSGAGGGGYLIFVNDQPIEGAIKIKIRRSNGY